MIRESTDATPGAPQPVLASHQEMEAPRPLDDAYDAQRHEVEVRELGCARRPTMEAQTIALELTQRGTDAHDREVSVREVTIGGRWGVQKAKRTSGINPASPHRPIVLVRRPCYDAMVSDEAARNVV